VTTTATHVAFDLGAESGRALAGRFDGARVELEVLRRFPTRAVRLPDGLYWDALGLLAELTGAVVGLRGSGVDVRSVGIDSWGVDFGLIDARGRLLANPLSYRNGHGDQAVHSEALARVSTEEIYAQTGIQFMPINTLFQLVALEAEGRLRGAETMLLIPDLLVYWLTEEKCAESTNASTTQLLDARHGSWALDLIRRLGLPEHIFPPLVEPGSVLEGSVPDEDDWRPLPVVVVASHDTASAVVAVPATSAGAAYISSGTWSLVGVETVEPVLSPRALAANLTNERGFGGTTRLLKNVMGLWLVQECRRAWLREGDVEDYAGLAQLAATAESGPLFDPDLPELLAPGDMPARIRRACGHDAPDSRAALLRSIFESLACKYRLVLEEIEDVTGSAIDTVHVVGGGAGNAFLCQLTADVSRRPVLAGPVEASGLGNLLVQLHAFGDVGSLAEMRELVRSSTELRTYEPDPAAGRWEALYARFRDVLDAEVLTR
jgi:rhamnulokinase